MIYQEQFSETTPAWGVQVSCFFYPGCFFVQTAFFVQVAWLINRIFSIHTIFLKNVIPKKKACSVLPGPSMAVIIISSSFLHLQVERLELRDLGIDPGLQVKFCS